MITAVQGWEALERDVEATERGESERWLEVVALYCGVTLVDFKSGSTAVSTGALVFDPKSGAIRVTSAKVFRRAKQIFA